MKKVIFILSSFLCLNTQALFGAEWVRNWWAGSKSPAAEQKRELSTASKPTPAVPKEESHIVEKRPLTETEKFVQETEEKIKEQLKPFIEPLDEEITQIKKRKRIYPTVAKSYDAYIAALQKERKFIIQYVYYKEFFSSPRVNALIGASLIGEIDPRHIENLADLIEPPFQSQEAFNAKKAEIKKEEDDAIRAINTQEKAIDDAIAQQKVVNPLAN